MMVGRVLGRIGRGYWIALGVLGCAVVVVANVYFVRVAFRSQPACVAHDRVADEATAQLRAAKSGCSWKAGIVR